MGGLSLNGPPRPSAAATADGAEGTSGAGPAGGGAASADEAQDAVEGPPPGASLLGISFKVRCREEAANQLVLRNVIAHQWHHALVSS